MQIIGPALTQEHIEAIKKLLSSYRKTKESVKVMKTDRSGTYFPIRTYKASVKHILGLYYPECSFGDLSIPIRDESIRKADETMKLIENAISYVYSNYKDGHLYGYILKYTYINSAVLSVPEIIGILNGNGVEISKKTYYKKREEAIEAFTNTIYSYASGKFDSLSPWLDEKGDKNAV